MASLNQKAKEGLRIDAVFAACTDITGFGLLGHCVEMASASGVTFELKVNDIAYFQDAVEYAKMGACFRLEPTKTEVIPLEA